MEEPNFKVYTDFETPSGDASLLRTGAVGGGDESSILNSTEIPSASGDAPLRPEPNLSVITAQSSRSTTTEPTLSVITAQSFRSTASVSVSVTISDPSCASQPGPAGIACDLCGQYVKGQAYLAQHRNKKKCTEKQRTQKQLRDQLEASIARMENLRVSESDTSNVDASKVFFPFNAHTIGGLAHSVNIYLFDNVRYGDPALVEHSLATKGP